MAKSKLTRRSFLQLTGGALGVTALAACVPAGEPAADDGSGAPAAAPGTLWVLHKQDFHPEYNDFMRAHIVQFAEDNGLELDVAFTSGFQGTGADVQKVAAAVQAGDPPDVWIDNQPAFQLAQLGLVQDVTDLQAEVSATYGDPTPRVTKELLLDGKWAGVPIHTRSDGGFARKDLFDAAGIDLTEIRTLDALRDATLAVSDPGNELWGWGMTINRSGDGGYLIMRAVHGFGGAFQDDTGELVTLDSDETVAAVEWMVDTYTNPQYADMLPPGILAWTDISNNEAYLGEKVAYTQNAGTVYAKAVADGLPVAEKTTYHAPVGGPALQEFNGLGGMYGHVITDAKNTEKANELILSFFNDEVMTAIYESAVAYALPAYAPMWEWESVTSNPVSAQLKNAALDESAWNGIFFPGPNNGHMGAVQNTNVHTDMVANVINGQMTAAESVADAHAKMIGIFQEFGAAGE